MREAGRGKVGRGNGRRGVGKFRNGQLGSGGCRAGDSKNLKSENIRRNYRGRYVLYPSQSHDPTFGQGTLEADLLS